jgi:flagellar basal body-associated protein FliL
MAKVNHTNSKKGKFGATMGVTSIIAILVILVLVVFAALSYTTSKADYSLSKKTAEVTTAYYEADARAEERTAEAARSAQPGTRISFTEKIDETQELQVTLLISEDGKVSRLKWQVAPSGDWTPDTSLNLIE